jgi:hypothetical protein
MNQEHDALVALLRVGVHWDAQVTAGGGSGNAVSQILCSALPVGYSNVPARHWEPFAQVNFCHAIPYDSPILCSRIRCSTFCMHSTAGGQKPFQKVETKMEIDNQCSGRRFELERYMFRVEDWFHSSL